MNDRVVKIFQVFSVVLVFVSQVWASPLRPPKVPAEAVWAGGVDGGAWILCHRLSKEPWGPFFECTTYNDYSGNVWSQGHYVIGHLENQTFQPVQRYDNQPRYTAYDGEIIYIGSADLFMVPHGEVDFPFASGGGKRVTYDHGKQIGPEINY